MRAARDRGGLGARAVTRSHVRGIGATMALFSLTAMVGPHHAHGHGMGDRQRGDDDDDHDHHEEHRHGDHARDGYRHDYDHQDDHDDDESLLPIPL